MVDYRLYVRSAETNAIEAVEMFQAPNDLAAIDLVQQSGEPPPMELWDHSRRVLRFDTRLAIRGPTFAGA